MASMDFNAAVVLGPMVRVTTHPMRLLALQYGATYVYTEEIIDFKLLRTIRVENAKLRTTDFVHPDGTVVFRTSAEEKGKVILQLVGHHISPCQQHSLNASRAPLMLRERYRPQSTWKRT
uniref:tRNA-dihydrouridine(20) synthase [NAD(P)+]-like n=1 Tax=Schistocephalus solidus TaxID=70667 RepID=A0A0X3PMP5_SCHSO